MKPTIHGPLTWPYCNVPTVATPVAGSIGPKYLPRNGPLTINPPAPAATSVVVAMREITSAVESGTTVTIATAMPHGFSANQPVRITGVGTGYDGNWAVDSVIDDTTFTYIASASSLANASGGTASGVASPSATYSRITSLVLTFNTAVSENLYQAGYVYSYAVVIDYNRFPARAGAGSAFFLHVTDGGPTAGRIGRRRNPSRSRRCRHRLPRGQGGS